jgi:hypothetical protein
MKLTAVHCGWMVAGLLPVLALAQAGKLDIPDFSDLAKKATEAVDITLDGDMLKSASHLMGGSGGHFANGQDMSSVVNGLKAITVRSFTFDKPDMYSEQEVAGVLAQADAPGWKKVISVHDKSGHVEIHMRADSEDGGLLIVTEEPKELTIVNIAGKINLDQLRQLQGHMGVPSMPGLVGASPPPAPPVPPVSGATGASPASPAAPAAPTPPSDRAYGGPGI